MTTSTLSIYLKFGRRILIDNLSKDNMAKVKIPTDEEIKNLKNAVAERHPALRDVWMTMDGLKGFLEQSPKTVIQNQFHNGWKHDHYVTNFLGFCPAGTIVVAAMNVPGCIHDSMVANWGEKYDKLEEVYDRTVGKCTVDSAFSKRRPPYLTKTSQKLPHGCEEIVINKEATAMRQSAEWGMRAFQSSFPRIKDRIIFEENGERRLILRLFVLLFIYRANMVGMNQIRNTYLSPLHDANANDFLI